MRALGLAVTALTLAAALAPVPALACGMVMREPVNLAELMDEVDEVKTEPVMAEAEVVEAQADKKVEPATADTKEGKAVAPATTS